MTKERSGRSGLRRTAQRLYRSLLRTAIRCLNAAGLDLARTRDYYSPLPVRSRLEKNRSRWDRPSRLAGLTYDLESMSALLERLVDRFAAELAALPGYEESRGLGYGPGFTIVDSQLLYCMLRHLRPRRYLEIGSGLSTYWAWQAVRRNRAEGAPCEMSCIDPFPSAELRRIELLEVTRAEVQDIELDRFERLEAGDVLFIDSTHVVKIDGDVPFLYLEVLPRLAVGVNIHSHDVHFPYNTPHPAELLVFGSTWPRYWTEAMLLQAFLAFNESFRIELSVPLLRFADESLLRRILPTYRPLDLGDTDTHAGSLWYRRVR